MENGYNCNQPLLIDGLAGTGKTAVLARRGVFEAGLLPDNEEHEFYIWRPPDAVVEGGACSRHFAVGKDDYWEGRHKRNS